MLQPRLHTTGSIPRRLSVVRSSVRASFVRSASFPFVPPSVCPSASGRHAWNVFMDTPCAGSKSHIIMTDAHTYISAVTSTCVRMCLCTCRWRGPENLVRYVVYYALYYDMSMPHLHIHVPISIRKSICMPNFRCLCFGVAYLPVWLSRPSAHQHKYICMCTLVCMSELGRLACLTKRKSCSFLKLGLSVTFRTITPEALNP